MRRILYFLKALSFILLLALISGCATSSSPLFNEYDADGNPVQHKRYRRYPERDLIVRWGRTAYKKNNSTGPHFLLSEDQETIKGEYGPPDYISETWLSWNRDYVTEWLYWQEGVMFQFVRRQLVYEGPLSDKERVLVTYGYPDKAHVLYVDDNMMRESFYYHSLFGLGENAYTFVNGKKVESRHLQ